jgi:hypothetical protein
MDLERALRFDNWANLETLATLKAVSTDLIPALRAGNF